jgi:hypothetical protein
MSTPSRWTGIRFALSRRNYRLFLAGQFVSLIGTWTRSVAQGWLVYRLTASAVWLGVITACQQVPIVLLASLGGSFADRYRRRTILVATQSASMLLSFVLAGLAWSDTVQLSHMVALAALAGVVAAVDMPTRQSFIVEMVGRDGLMTAIAINASLAMGAASLGPVVAGYGVQALGEGWCFFADGASFAAVIAGLLAMRDLPAPSAARPMESLAARSPGRGDDDPGQRDEHLDSDRDPRRAARARDGDLGDDLHGVCATGRAARGLGREPRRPRGAARDRGRGLRARGTLVPARTPDGGGRTTARCGAARILANQVDAGQALIVDRHTTPNVLQNLGSLAALATCPRRSTAP